MRRKKEEK